MTLQLKPWASFFPFPAPRAEQVRAIDFVLDAFLVQDKEFVVMELGLGVGKSAVAATIINYFNAYHPEVTSLLPQDTEEEYDVGGYILTAQKILQEQYMRDFAKPPTDLVTIKSAANFDCTGRPGTTCADSRRVYEMLKDRFPKGPQNHCRQHCPYKAAKQCFTQGMAGVTNYSYFLAETMYAKKLKPRQMLVIDEAHNTEGALGKFVELRITEKFSAVLKLKFPKTNDLDKAFSWMSKKYEPALAKYINKLCGDIAGTKDDGQAIKLSKRLETLDKHICKIHRFQATYDRNNWVLNFERDRDGSGWEFKPIDVAPWTRELLYRLGQKKLLMTATILDYDYYCKSVGIDKSKSAFISIDSPFKPANKPIMYVPAGKMSYESIDKSLPKVSAILAEILKEHQNEKGIVHCVNFKVVKYLTQNLPSEFSKRMLFQLEGVDRNALLEKHTADPGPTVLVSPSMTEGVDLKDDLSRFQVFCKIPFPSLADQVIKKRMENNKMSYPYATAQSIIQAVGRSVRNENDWAVTYILDECWESFYRTNEHLFPASFKDSIQKL